MLTESTGILPPTPTLSNAVSTASVVKFAEPPDAIPKTEAMKRVRFHDHLAVSLDVQGEVCSSCTNLLPHMSQPKLHSTAPTSKPMFADRDKKGELKPNSFTTGDKIRPVSRGQTLSLNQPKPDTTNNAHYMTMSIIAGTLVYRLSYLVLPHPDFLHGLVQYMRLGLVNRVDAALILVQIRLLDTRQRRVDGRI